MKKSSLPALVIVAATAISIMSCKKNNSASASSNTNQDGQTMAAFMEAHGPKFESFTVDATAGASFTSSKGIKYTIPAGAFVTSDGAAVTGSVTVAVKEINSPSDMILGDKPTLTSDGRMLTSYGEFFVKASQNNQDLLLKKDSSVKVQVPAKPNGQEIPMWGGDSAATFTLSGYDYLNAAVTISVQAPVRRGIAWNQINTSYAFFNSANGTLDFKLDSLVKWRNCDAILSNNSDPKTTFLGYFNSHYNSLTVTDYSGDQPTALYFKPHNQNTLIKVYDIILNATGTHQGFISYESSMPIGMQGTFLAISTENGKFYADMQDATIAAPTGLNNYTTLTFDPQEVSETAMVNLILSMNSK
jgi:hypothetical protein